MRQPDNRIFEIGHILGDDRDISGEYWMTNLSPLLRQLPLIYLCIPGTINSHEYSMEKTYYKNSQHSSITSQLFNGIRYLNISITSVIKGKWMCTLVLSLRDILRQVNLFALTHQDEVIFLEINTVDVKCIEYVIEILSHILFTDDSVDDYWIKKHSLHFICKSKKNVILLNTTFSSKSNRVLKTCTKYITTNSVQKIDKFLSLADVSVCSTFKIPPYAIKLNLRTYIHDTMCDTICDRLFTDENKYRTDVSLVHEYIIQYVNNGANMDNLNKIFVFCVEFECYIDLLYLCMQIMDKRFFQ